MAIDTGWRSGSPTSDPRGPAIPFQYVETINSSELTVVFFRCDPVNMPNVQQFFFEYETRFKLKEMFLDRDKV